MNSIAENNPVPLVADQVIVVPSAVVRRLNLTLVFGALICFAISILQFAVMTFLPYTTSLINSVSESDALRAPNMDFALGSVRWNLESYGTDPTLAEFRSYFKAHCNALLGLQAAVCVSDALAREIAFGDPGIDFLRAQYDPIQDFNAKRNGQPAYCVNFSAFLTNILLSARIPARVVQFIPDSVDGLGGHTLVEVWDAGSGWTMIDPSSGGLAACNGQPCSAVEALHFPDQITWQPLQSPANSVDGRKFYTALKRSLAGAKIVYPEPWYYTRTGERAATFPFRGTFVVVGRPHWQFGSVQTLLRVGIVLSALLGVTLLGIAAWKFVILPRRIQP